MCSVALLCATTACVFSYGAVRKSSLQQMDIREIKPDKLTYSIPKIPIVQSKTSELFKGEYNKFTVAIKRFTCQSSPEYEFLVICLVA